MYKKSEAYVKVRKEFTKLSVFMFIIIIIIFKKNVVRGAGKLLVIFRLNLVYTFWASEIKKYKKWVIKIQTNQ